MNNELDQRLSRLEASQAQLLSGQRQMVETLTALAALMQQPDEEGVKLHEVLAQLVAVIGVNTATLQDLKQTITDRPEGLT